MNSSNLWQIRTDHQHPIEVPSPQKVLQGIANGDWQPQDEVRGPGERIWMPIEEHLVFADAISEMGPPPSEKPDETRLDMNPLIDVALVLLIFFILTTSYASLRRAMDLPDESKEGSSRTPSEKLKDIAFRITLEPDPTGKPTIRVDSKVVSLENLETELRELIQSTGKKEAILVVNGEISWGVNAEVQAILNSAGISKVHWPKSKPSPVRKT